MKRALIALRYVGLAAIIFFLIKALHEVNVTGDNKSIGAVVCLIMGVIIVMTWHMNKKCVENYEELIPPLVNSIYPEKKQDTTTSTATYKVQDYADDDIKDMEKISGINMDRYNQLKENEQRAMDKITANYHDDMVNTKTHPFNTVALGAQLYGYTYLPPENWFRAYERPPVCITDKPCQVCPSSDTKIANLLQYDSSGDVDTKNVDLRYIKQKLNIKSDNLV